MLFETEKMSVAQNCERYKPNRINMSSGFGSMSESCDSCSNYVKGICKTNNYERTLNLININ